MTLRHALVYPCNGSKTRTNPPHEKRQWGDRCPTGHGPEWRPLVTPAPDQGHPSTGREIWSPFGGQSGLEDPLSPYRLNRLIIQLYVGNSLWDILAGRDRISASGSCGSF